MIRGAVTNARAAVLAVLWSCVTAAASFGQAGATLPPSDAAFEAVLAEVFDRSEASVVRFPNPLTGGYSTNTVYVAR